MRTLLILILLTATLGAQDVVIKDFIKEHRRGEENVALTVPGFLIGLASSIAVTAAEDDDERALFRLLGDLGTVRMVTYENADFRRPEASIGNLLYSLERYRGFERWAELRTQDGTRITLTVRYHKKKIREILTILTEDDRTTLVAAKAQLSAEELGRVVNDLESL
ncbi:hypothetical protein LEM8419_00103 [Neolewinella maritima]|uniref:DUF4252 domain-containing protein n=1 Tax=Neolewinella maritima TaxID=1383882 RepID=A0ABM9AVU1_9BACT|nr:DUF4252 domain-containing protein [Neolewinella maritima]CAH0998755.1 hypothetical protein LEM8419_00103 [Neolewinella maritima]